MLGGTEINDVATSLRGLKTSISSLDAAFPSMGSLWTASGMTPQAHITEAVFTQTVQSILPQAKAASLGLAGSFDPMTMPDARDLEQSTTVTPDLGAASPNSVLTPAGNGFLVITPGGGNMAGWIHNFDAAIAGAEVKNGFCHNKIQQLDCPDGGLFKKDGREADQ